MSHYRRWRWQLLNGWRRSFLCFLSLVVIVIRIGHVIGVPLDVSLHFFLVLERFVANGAFVALGAVVLHAMQLQNVIVAKVTVANVATIGFFARMRA